MDIGAYRITRRIGSGGFGEVFLAVHQILRRQVALKVIHPRLAGDPQAVELFLREARMIAQFDHPNVVGVYDAGRGDNDLVYMAMRFVAGGSLQELLERAGPPPKLQALAIMRDCCAGLAAIHNLGLVHRDIKPANVLIEADGRACITDLGLACLQREQLAGVDGAGVFVGTPLYMAPEQLTGAERASQRSDLYALGITFYALLTGEVPLAGLSYVEVLRRAAAGELFDPRAVRACLGTTEAALLRELTAPDPQQRPAGAASVLQRIEALLAEAEGRAPYAGPKGRASPSVVATARTRLEKDQLVKAILDALPGPALVLNESRQVVTANGKAVALLGTNNIEALVGRRFGEALGCEDAARGNDGCGTSPACAFCGLGRAIAAVERGKRLPLEGECHLCRQGGRIAFDFAFRLTSLGAGNDGFVLVALRDVSAEKRRDVLERSVVANLLETADMVRAMTAAPSGLLSDISKALTEEAAFQQHLLAAERGELQPLWDDCAIGPLLAEVCERFGHHPVSEGRRLCLRCPQDLRVRTDRLLLQRSVRNLVRNALEACAVGEDVTLEARADGSGGVEISVHNAQIMSHEAQEQVFKRCYSTKAAGGRGIGTHAARLFVESYLHGQIGVSSSSPLGTTFWIRLPPRPPSDSGAPTL